MVCASLPALGRARWALCGSCVRRSVGQSQHELSFRLMAAIALSPALSASCVSLFGVSEARLGARSRGHSESGAPAARLLASAAVRRGQLTKAGRLLWDVLVANPRDREARLALVSVMMM